MSDEQEDRIPITSDRLRARGWKAYGYFPTVWRHESFHYMVQSPLAVKEDRAIVVYWGGNGGPSLRYIDELERKERGNK